MTSWYKTVGSFSDAQERRHTCQKSKFIEFRDSIGTKQGINHGNIHQKLKKSDKFMKCF